MEHFRQLQRQGPLGEQKTPSIRILLLEKNQGVSLIVSLSPRNLSRSFRLQTQNRDDGVDLEDLGQLIPAVWATLGNKDIQMDGYNVEHHYVQTMFYMFYPYHEWKY